MSCTEERNTLLEAINSLPVELQLPFALRFEHGLRNAEIAECLHMAEREVELAHNRALDLLRPALEPFIS